MRDRLTAGRDALNVVVLVRIQLSQFHAIVICCSRKNTNSNLNLYSEYSFEVEVGQVVELVYTRHSKRRAERHESSNLSLATVEIESNLK
jgi:hypothetical protein